MQALEQLRRSAVWGEALVAWRWWTGELGAMVPERVRIRLGGRRHSLIHLRQGSVQIDRIVDGTGERFIEACAIDAFAADNWAELDALTRDCRIRLVLGPPDVHVIALTLPKAARSRLRAAIGLQLHHLAPLEPEHLVWAFETTAMNERHIMVRVAMARASRIAQLQGLFDAHDLRMPPVDAQCDDGLIRLASGEERPRDPERTLAKRVMAGACLLLLSIPFTTLAGAALLGSLTDARVLALETAIAPKVDAERRWRSAETLRQALAPLMHLPLASPALEDLARRLPVTSYAECVEQAPDRSLLVTVSTADAQKTLTALGASTVVPSASLVDQTSSGEPGRTTAIYRSSPR